MGNILFRDIVKSVSYSMNEILYNIMLLHNGGKPYDCDITYSKGCFYGTDTGIPQPRIKMDVCPRFNDVIQIEPFKPLPLEDKSVKSLVMDLPFVIGGGKNIEVENAKSNMMLRRFSRFRKPEEMYANYEWWIKEAARVITDDGLIVFKCQNQMYDVQHWAEAYSIMVAEDNGLYCDDEFVLVARTRLIGKMGRQFHSRKFHSFVLVFKKATKKKHLKYKLMDIAKQS